MKPKAEERRFRRNSEIAGNIVDMLVMDVNMSVLQPDPTETPFGYHKVPHMLPLNDSDMRRRN